ncbi:MAG: hypothetical protein ACLU4J_02770 [Butyricimonas paravirosa]
MMNRRIRITEMWGYFSSTLVCRGICGEVTDDSEDGDDGLNENRIKTLDVFIYKRR